MAGSDIRSLGRSIKVIHEGDSFKTDPGFQRTHALLSGASMIVFLGFGYNDRNLERLFADITFQMDLKIFGSFFAFTDLERRRTSDKVHTLTNRLMGEGDYDQLTLKLNVVDYLRHKVRLD
jgi:hypothetical protein